MGSEMCIRDRADDAHLQPRRGHGGLGEAQVGKAQEHALALVAGCLLYTSDAADERSSVDLGGRRIIKKKKRASDGSWTCIRIMKYKKHITK